MANSPEYRTIIKLTSELTNAFKDDLMNLSGEFRSANFISDDNADDLRNTRNGAKERAANLVGWIRNKIQLDPENKYRAFIDVLKQRFADNETILKRLDEQYKELNPTPPEPPPGKKFRKFNRLDQVIDSGTKAPVHIGLIAEEVVEWEGALSDGLDLSPTDVKSIKTSYDRDLKGQTREALLTWKKRKGDEATYNNLIKILEGAGNKQCADFIRNNLTFAEA